MSAPLAPLVVKVGGNELSQPGWLARLAATLAGLAAELPVVLVHGGGREVDRLLGTLAIEPHYLDGQRVTDEPTLAAVEMVLSGQVNKTIVRELLDAGVAALGVSGCDLGILSVEPWAPGMGRVGRIVAVDDVSLSRLLATCRVLALSPISRGADGAYNVNADHAAGAVAAALGAPLAIFLTDVPGVLRGGERIDAISLDETEALIEAGVIHGGMVPKVRAATDAVRQGVCEARITNLAGLAVGTGTTFRQTSVESLR